MTIYLYVKTHRKTGLKYLGKTNKNPFKYPGSGVHWTRHLLTHGDDVATEILRECSSNDEVKQWGLYYSDLWNIVESKEWANLKPEEGDGGCASGEDNYAYDFTEHKFQNIKSGEVVTMTQNKLCSTYGLSKGCVSLMLSGHRTRVKDWALYGKDFNLPKVYEFKNKFTGERVEMTVSDLSKKYDVERVNVYSMIRQYPTKNLSVKGWQVIGPAQTV